ncbi:hypothetical protein EON66_01060 [archaeon]|nr:MAG: hypothetical protein EON66_01060 [archaeon]
MAAQAGTYPAGLLVGGMSDGAIQVWNVQALLDGHGEHALLSSVQRHTAAVRALQFNLHPFSQHLVAAGSTDGSISIINLENPTAPSCASLYVPLCVHARARALVRPSAYRLMHRSLPHATHMRVARLCSAHTAGHTAMVRKPWSPR